jgi:hypothetical protein
MAEKRIVYTSPVDGMVKIVIPAYNDITRPAGESEDDLLARVIAKSVPDGVTHSIVDATDIPTDRYFRHAWTWSD